MCCDYVCLNKYGSTFTPPVLPENTTYFDADTIVDTRDKRWLNTLKEKARKEKIFHEFYLKWNKRVEDFLGIRLGSGNA